MFSNNSVMDLPHFKTHPPTNKMKHQGHQQQLLFLSDITNPKSKSIPWLKNDKQHRNATSEHAPFGFPLQSRPKQLPLSDRRNQPLPTLPLSPSSSSPTPPMSPSLSTPSFSSFKGMKKSVTSTTLLPSSGSLRKKQDESFLKLLEHKHAKTGTKISSKSTTTSSVRSRQSDRSNKNPPTPISPTLRSLPSISSHSSRMTASNQRRHQPTPIPVHKINRARSSSSASEISIRPKELPLPLPSPPLPTPEESVNKILAQISSSVQSMSTTTVVSPAPPSLVTSLASSLSTPMTVSPSSSSSSSSSSSASSSASSAINTYSAKNKCSATSYPLTQKSYEEQDRMVAQHYLLRTAFNGNDYMASGMTSTLKQGCIALDMGCNSGTWTMELATAYPNSYFIGLDQLALFPRDIKPKNCHFATCDLTCLPLPIPDASVDYIFQRDLNWALLANQWPLLIKEYLRILKPGGWIELMEMDIESQSSQRQERIFNDKLIYGLSMRQQDPYVARRLPSILAINGFRRVSSQFQSLPLGWGKSHQHQKESRSKSTSKNNNNTHPLLSPTPSSVSVSSISSSSSSSSSSSTCSKYARAAASQYKFMLQSLCPWFSTVMGCSSDKYMVAIDQLESEWCQAHTYIKWHSAVAQKPLHK